MIVRVLEQTKRFVAQIFRQGPVLAAWAALDTILRYVSGAPFKRFSQITPHIAVGGQPARRVWKTLFSQRGYTGVINMRSEYDYAREVRSGELRYLHLPTEDNTAPSLEHLKKGVSFIREEAAKGGGVYIHCWEGLGRGPTMAAAYLVSTGMTIKEAWETIRNVRPFIRPTQVQIDQLHVFAKQYHTPEMEASGVAEND